MDYIPQYVTMRGDDVIMAQRDVIGRQQATRYDPNNSGSLCRQNMPVPTGISLLRDELRQQHRLVMAGENVITI